MLNSARIRQPDAGRTHVDTHDVSGLGSGYLVSRVCSARHRCNARAIGDRVNRTRGDAAECSQRQAQTARLIPRERS